jgi:thioredoxin 1
MVRGGLDADAEEEESMRDGRRVTTVVAAMVLSLTGAMGCGEASSAEVRARSAATSTNAAPGKAVPHLVDVGAGKCIPCKAMAPILEQLRADYVGRLRVTFVDVWESPDAARPYAIRMIPTQIFYGADGRELARHEGFMSREDIVAQWKALGVEL